MSAKKSKPVHDEIIRLYLLFHTYTEIAAKLGIDRGTVAAHVNEYEAERERAAVAQALAKQEAKQEKAKERSAARSKAKSRPQPDGPLETLQTSSSDRNLGPSESSRSMVMDPAPSPSRSRTPASAFRGVARVG